MNTGTALFVFVLDINHVANHWLCEERIESYYDDGDDDDDDNDWEEEDIC